LWLYSLHGPATCTTKKEKATEGGTAGSAVPDYPAVTLRLSTVEEFGRNDKGQEEISWPCVFYQGAQLRATTVLADS